MGEDLRQLVENGDLDHLLELVTLDNIAQAWCRHHSRSLTSDELRDDPDWWAVDLLGSGEIFEGPGVYRTLLLRLVAHASNDVLGLIGAGPLEDFVSDDEDDLRWLEQECATNAGLRQALAGAWCAGHVSDATLTRIESAAGVELARPRPREEWTAEHVALEDALARFTEMRRSHPEDVEALTAQLKVVEEASKAADEAGRPTARPTDGGSDGGSG